MPGPIFMEENNNDTPTPEPGPDYSIPFYVENITQEDETLTIAGIDSSGGNNYLEIPIEYSTDSTNWSSLSTTGETPLTKVLHPGERVYLRATTDVWYEYQEGTDEHGEIDHGCTIFDVSKVGGNIMSLLYGSSFTGNETAFPSGSVENFYELFVGLKGNSKLISASELILPATTLAEACYNEMFLTCTSLTTTPVLPATTLAAGCYGKMFSGCTSLTTAPELPATTLAAKCYSWMFSGCTSLTTAPELPATTLAAGCYSWMFSGCTSLTINDIPILPATTLAEDCYRKTFSSITMNEGEYNIWCSENIPAAANYDESIHGRLFDVQLES